MAIDASIALGVKPVQLESPINQMSNVYALQNAAQSNQLNQMKMEEYKRGLAEEDQFKNALLSSKDDAGIKNAFYSLGQKGVKAYADYQKSNVESKKLGYETDKLKNDLIDAKLKQSKEFLSTVTTPEQYLAWHEANHADPVLGPALAARGVTQDTARAEIEAAMAKPGGFQELLQKSAIGLAKFTELNKPSIHVQNIGGSSNVLSVPGLGGAPTTLSSTKMTATPGEIMTRDTQRRGQDLTNARELQRIEIEKGRNSPEYIAMKSKMEEQGKNQAKFEVAAPQAIATAEQALNKIDQLVGKPAKLNAKGEIVEKGTAAHPGFKAAVGASSLFPTIPGSKAADFEARLDEIKGGAFLEAYNTLRGGGSITEVEGQKATQAITRMSTAQSEREFIDAARDFQNVIRTGIKRSKEKLGSSGTDVDALLEKYK